MPIQLNRADELFSSVNSISSVNSVSSVNSINSVNSVNLVNKITLEVSVAEQMNLGVEFSNAYLNPISGEIYRIHDFNLEISDADVPLIKRCVMLPSVTSQDTYLWMQKFAVTVPDLWLRLKLSDALNQIGACWKFRNVLYHRPIEMEQWEQFNQRCLRHLAREWLEQIQKEQKIPAR